MHYALVHPRFGFVATLIGCALVSVLDAQATLVVDVVTADEVVAASASARSPLPFTSAAGHRLDLSLDPSAHSGARFPGVTEWSVVEEVSVRKIVEAMAPLDGADLAIRIYCLPGLPLDVGKSYAIGREIFLAPSFLPQAVETLAATVVHEIGHCVENTRMSDAGWEQFSALRGLGDQHRADSTAHRDRPAEIFAEDFRLLFGGESARFNGPENAELLDAREVEGLSEFFTRALRGGFLPELPKLRVSNAPNPFNPSTTIRVALRAADLVAAAVVEADLFDARGRHVRSFPDRPVQTSMEWTFDGSDDSGRRLASGRYTLLVRAGAHRATRSLVLVK